MSQVSKARPDSRTVLVTIRSAIPSLRPSERRIAETILTDPQAMANLSISELAALCETSTTSVVRFYQGIGYDRFRDLRLDITREITRETAVHSQMSEASGDIDRDDSLTDVIDKVAFSETLSIADTAKVLNTDDLARAEELTDRASRIDIFGVGASSFVGQDLQQKLIRIGKTALNWPDPHSAWTSAVTLDPSCVAIAVSHSGQTESTIEFLTLARKAGATTIAITNFEDSPFAQAADLTLVTAARETLFRSGALGSRIAQLMVVDCLFIGVAQASFDSSMEALRDTYSAVHDEREAQNS